MKQPSTDFRSLGRLGTHSSKRRRRKRRRSRPLSTVAARIGVGNLIGIVVVGVLGVLALVLLLQPTDTQEVLSAGVLPQLDEGLTERLLAGEDVIESRTAVELTPGGGTAVVRRDQPAPVIAGRDGLLVTSPVTEPARIAFSEGPAATMLGLVPIGALADRSNLGSYNIVEQHSGPAFSILEPRTGVRPGTALITLQAASSVDLLAPVSGEVHSVTEDQSGVTVTFNAADRPGFRVGLRTQARVIAEVGDDVMATQPVGMVASNQDGVTIEVWLEPAVGSSRQEENSQ